jgi:hypothetical protein
MPPPPSVAVVSFSPVCSDSRVLRQIQSLGSFFPVYSIGLGPSPDGVESHFQAPYLRGRRLKLMGALLLLMRRFDSFYDLWFHRRNVLTFIAENDIRAVVLNDATSWPLARDLPAGIAILDAHEYSPHELSDQLLWKLFLGPFKAWCSQFASFGTSRFCVEAHLCALWEQFSGCSFQLLPNSSPYTPASQPRTQTSGSLRILHHGVAHPSRRIELMMEAIAMAGSAFCGSFLLTGSDHAYLRRLQSLAVSCRCEVLPPVPQQDLIACGSGYDLAILSIYPSNLNYAHCLPNKLYQFIQSRLPIVCGPTPAIARIVSGYEIGVVADGFSAAALAAALQSLTPLRLEQMRRNLEQAARELCWEKDQRLLVEAVQAVMGSGD